MEILTPRASKLIPRFALPLASKVRRYLPHLSPWCRVRRNVEPTVLPRLREASNKLKTGSLSQRSAAPSKARISLRVSYQDNYLGDVAILISLTLGKPGSTKHVVTGRWSLLESWCFARFTAFKDPKPKDTLSLGSHISAIKAFGPKLTSCKRGHRESFERSAHVCIQILPSQGLVPQPIALQRANFYGNFVCLCSRFFGWCHLSLACFCDVICLLSNPFCWRRSWLNLIAGSKKWFLFTPRLLQLLRINVCRSRDADWKFTDMSATLFADLCPMSASFLTNGSDNDDTCASARHAVHLLEALTTITQEVLGSLRTMQWGQWKMRLSLTATMQLRIPFCESRGRHVVMELLPFGPRCDYFPVLPCSRHRAYQSELRYDQVAFRSLQSFWSVDETILDALFDLLWRQTLPGIKTYMEGCNGCTLRLSARYSVRRFSSCTGQEEPGEKRLLQLQRQTLSANWLSACPWFFASFHTCLEVVWTFRALVMEKVSPSKSHNVCLALCWK